MSFMTNQDAVWLWETNVSMSAMEKVILFFSPTLCVCFNSLHCFPIHSAKPAVALLSPVLKNGVETK